MIVVIIGLQTKAGGTIDFETFKDLTGVSFDATTNTATVTLPIADGSGTTFDFSFVLSDRIDVTLADGTTHIFADEGINTGVSLDEGTLASGEMLFEFGQTSFNGEIIDLSYIDASSDDSFYSVLGTAFEVVLDDSNTIGIGLQTKAGGTIDFETFTNLDEVQFDATTNTATVTLPIADGSGTTFDFSFVLSDIAPDITGAQFTDIDSSNVSIDGDNNTATITTEVSFVQGNTTLTSTTLFTVDSTTVSDPGGGAIELLIDHLPAEIKDLFEVITKTNGDLSLQIKEGAIFDYNTINDYTSGADNNEYVNVNNDGEFELTLKLGTQKGTATTDLKFNFNVETKSSNTVTNSDDNTFINTNLVLTEGQLPTSVTTLFSMTDFANVGFDPSLHSFFPTSIPSGLVGLIEIDGNTILLKAAADYNYADLLSLTDSNYIFNSETNELKIKVDFELQSDGAIVDTFYLTIDLNPGIYEVDDTQYNTEESALQIDVYDTLDLTYSNLELDAGDNDNVLDSTESHDIYVDVTDVAKIDGSTAPLDLGNISLHIDGINNLEDFKTLVKSIEVSDSTDIITIEFKNDPTASDTDANPAPTTTLALHYTGIDGYDADSDPDGVDLSDLAIAIGNAADTDAKLDILTGDQNDDLDGIQPVIEFDFT